MRFAVAVAAAVAVAVKMRKTENRNKNRNCIKTANRKPQSHLCGFVAVFFAVFGRFGVVVAVVLRFLVVLDFWLRLCLRFLVVLSYCCGFVWGYEPSLEKLKSAIRSTEPIFAAMFLQNHPLGAIYKLDLTGHFFYKITPWQPLF